MTEDKVGGFLNNAKGIVCHVFTKSPLKEPVFDTNKNAKGNFVVSFHFLILFIIHTKYMP